MWSRESPMKEYARKHPGCSLQEYCEYLDNIAREEAERRRLKEEENNQLLKSFEGKCFQINFNRQSFGYFKITKDITADKSKFSIEEFSKAVERFNNPIPKPIVDDEDNCTVEERKALNEYYEYRRHNFHSLSYFYVSSDIKFANLSVGDDFYGEEIIAIDKKLGIVVTKENNEVNYYWVKDPNSKPSLYRRGTYNSLVL